MIVQQQSQYLKLVRTGPGVLSFKPNQGKFFEKHFNNEAQALSLIAANGGQTFKSSFIVWDQTTNRSVAELLTPPKANKTDAVGVAKDFLQDELESGPLPVDQIQAAAKAAGISWPSVLRAKRTMLITSEKIGSGWTWTLITTKEKGNV